MLAEQEDVFYYLTVMNENYAQPALPEGAEEGILRGMHRVARRRRARPIQLLGLGDDPARGARRRRAAADEWGVEADVWSASPRSPSCAATAWRPSAGRACTRRASRAHAVRRRAAAPTGPPVVAATDYMRAFADLHPAVGRRAATPCSAPTASAAGLPPRAAPLLRGRPPPRRRRRAARAGPRRRTRRRPSRSTRSIPTRRPHGGADRGRRPRHRRLHRRPGDRGARRGRRHGRASRTRSSRSSPTRRRWRSRRRSPASSRSSWSRSATRSARARRWRGSRPPRATTAPADVRRAPRARGRGARRRGRGRPSRRSPPRRRPTSGPDGSDADAAAAASRAREPRRTRRPLARRMARELGVDLGAVQRLRPQGPDHQGRRASAPAERRRPGRQAPAAAPPRRQGRARRADRIQARSARQPRARRGRRSRTSPTTTTPTSPTLEAFRKQLNAEQSDVKVTMVALLLKACAATLDAFPRFASLARRRRARHQGRAPPRLRGRHAQRARRPGHPDVDRKGLLELAGELTELSGKARAGKLVEPEISGAVFTISSLGGIGGTGFTPIVNPPQVAILGVVRSAHEAGVGRRRVRAAADPAAVAVLRPPRHRRRGRGALLRAPRRRARRPAPRPALRRA